jgi:hypothetical protein
MRDLWTVEVSISRVLREICAERGLRFDPQPSMDKPPAPPAACPKCRSDQTKVVGTSQQPMLTYFGCKTCGHVFVPQVSRT